MPHQNQIFTVHSILKTCECHSLFRTILYVLQAFLCTWIHFLFDMCEWQPQDYNSHSLYTLSHDTDGRVYVLYIDKAQIQLKVVVTVEDFLPSCKNLFFFCSQLLPNAFTVGPVHTSRHTL